MGQGLEGLARTFLDRAVLDLSQSLTVALQTGSLPDCAQLCSIVDNSCLFRRADGGGVAAGSGQGVVVVTAGGGLSREVAEETAREHSRFPELRAGMIFVHNCAQWSSIALKS